MQWRDSAQIERTLEDAFNTILLERMRNTPLLNPALSVQAIGFGRVEDDWIGVLITPWFMNLVLLPSATGGWCRLPAGTQFKQEFPFGGFMFTVANEARLGVYAQCSLFSPMFQFQDQAAAVAAAQSALNALLTPPSAPALSRRDLFRLRIGKQ